MPQSWRNVLFLAGSDLRQKLREKETFIWVFLMPLVFFFFLGEVTSGFTSRGGGGESTELYVETPGDPGPVTKRILDRLEKERFRVLPWEPGAGLRAPRRLLRFPADLEARVARMEVAAFQYRRDPGQNTDARDVLRIRKALYTCLADLVLIGRDEKPIGAESFAEIDGLRRSLELEVGSAGKRRSIPSGYQQTIPGTMVMFTLMMMMTACAILLVTERNLGLFRRLAATPISRGELIAGKLAGFLGLGFVQVGYAMLAGSLLFGMQWGPSYFAVFVLLLAWIFFAAAAGLFFGCVARSEAQAQSLGILVVLLLAALGGCWWPIEIVPRFLQDLASCLPTGWAMRGLHQLVSFGGGFAEALPWMSWLVGAGLLLLVLSIRRFRYE